MFIKFFPMNNKPSQIPLNVNIHCKVQWENPNKRRKRKQEEKCNQKAEEVLRFCTCRIGIPSKGTALIEWRLREEFRKFFSSLWLRGESLFVNESVIETLSEGNFELEIRPDYFFPEGDFSRSRKIISCDFVFVDFLNRIRFSCGFYWLLKCTACAFDPDVNNLTIYSCLTFICAR